MKKFWSERRPPHPDPTATAVVTAEQHEAPGADPVASTTAGGSKAKGDELWLTLGTDVLLTHYL